jgi:putative FmdB family regulatory protein
MPLYEFQCTDCSTKDFRVAASFEDQATCHICGGLMAQLSDPFAPEPSKPCAWCQAEIGEVSPPGVSHGICQRHATAFYDEAPK